MGTSVEFRVAAAVAMAVVAGSGPVAAGGPLPAASSDEHIWFVVESSPPQPRIELRHHATEMDGPFYSRGVPLSRTPEAMAAWGNRLWLIYDGPKLGQTSVRREVFTVEVVLNPALGLYTRLGFRPIGDTGVYHEMEWVPGKESRPPPKA